MLKVGDGFALQIKSTKVYGAELSSPILYYLIAGFPGELSADDMRRYESEEETGDFR